MKPEYLENWQSLSDRDKRDVFVQIAADKNIPESAVEKDWWVVRALELVFLTEAGPHIVFKGGTSLSKAWNLIDRFSEDIDLAIDRSFLGFDQPVDEMTPSRVEKLRKRSFAFLNEVLLPALQAQFGSVGLSATLSIEERKADNQDPLQLVLNYEAVTTAQSYLPQRVLIEIGSRSLIEPFELRPIRSMVSAYFPAGKFSDPEIEVPAVHPRRTFLEKILLLHEEFQLAPDEKRILRKTRHWSDLERLMDTPYAKEALTDAALFDAVVSHRQKFNLVKGVDYSRHRKGAINLMPPQGLMDRWQADYEAMRIAMLYNEPPSFEKVWQRMQELQDRLNKQ